MVKYHSLPIAGRRDLPTWGITPHGLAFDAQDAGGAPGFEGLPLAVVVMMAALPVGSNALIFSQRYAALEAEATAAIVFSTLGFVATVVALGLEAYGT